MEEVHRILKNQIQNRIYQVIKRKNPCKPLKRNLIWTKILCLKIHLVKYTPLIMVSHYMLRVPSRSTTVLICKKLIYPRCLKVIAVTFVILDVLIHWYWMMVKRLKEVENIYSEPITMKFKDPCMALKIGVVNQYLAELILFKLRLISVKISKLCFHLIVH